MSTNQIYPNRDGGHVQVRLIGNHGSIDDIAVAVPFERLNIYGMPVAFAPRELEVNGRVYGLSHLAMSGMAVYLEVG